MTYFIGRVNREINKINASMRTMIDCLPVFLTTLFTWEIPIRDPITISTPSKRPYGIFTIPR